MKRKHVITIIIIAIIFVLPFTFKIIVDLSPVCTIDNGGFGSQIVQTCDCVGYEHFGNFDNSESAPDSKCIGYISDVQNK